MSRDERRRRWKSWKSWLCRGEGASQGLHLYELFPCKNRMGVELEIESKEVVEVDDTSFVPSNVVQQGGNLTAPSFPPYSYCFQLEYVLCNRIKANYRVS